MSIVSSSVSERECHQLNLPLICDSYGKRTDRRTWIILGEILHKNNNISDAVVIRLNSSA